jgi:hypothetical protein
MQDLTMFGVSVLGLHLSSFRNSGGRGSTVTNRLSTEGFHRINVKTVRSFTEKKLGQLNIALRIFPAQSSSRAIKLSTKTFHGNNFKTNSALRRSIKTNSR